MGDTVDPKLHRVALLVLVTAGNTYGAREEPGLGCIAAALRQTGHEVALFIVHQGTDALDGVIRFSPDIVGITTYDHSIEYCMQVCEVLKARLPQVRTCLGGCTATFHAALLLESSPAIDFVVRGEGEVTTAELIACLEEGRDVTAIRGLTFRHHGNAVSNPEREHIPDLDCVPFQARDLLATLRLGMAQVSTSRGCYRRCSFCVSHGFWTRDGVCWRGRSVRNVVDELAVLVAEHGMHRFGLMDASFEDPGGDYSRLREFAEEICSRGLSISYAANFRVDFRRDEETLELLRLLRNSGLCLAFLGVESGNKEDLRLYAKPDRRHNEPAIEFFRRAGIAVRIGFININPYSTFAGLRENLSFLQRNQLATEFKTLTRVKLFKGTRLYQKVLDDGLAIKTSDWNVSYRYVDPRIGTLVSYLDDFLTPLDKVHRFRPRLELITREHVINRAHYKRQYTGPDREQLDAILDACDTTIDSCLTEFSHRHCRWFSTLLELAESNWSTQDADVCTERYVGEQYLLDMMRKLERTRMRMIFDLLRFAPDLRAVL